MMQNMVAAFICFESSETASGIKELSGCASDADPRRRFVGSLLLLISKYLYRHVDNLNNLEHYLQAAP
jgi:hypothetical protein